jgi:RNAse (barnase) inhibitor barstar
MELHWADSDMLRGMKIFEIDGSRFSTLEGFFEEFSAQVIPGAAWGKNLNALDDVLHGGFGTPEEGYALRWKNSAISKRTLGAAFGTIVDIFRSHDDIPLKLE